MSATVPLFDEPPPVQRQLSAMHAREPWRQVHLFAPRTRPSSIFDDDGFTP